MDDCSPAVRFSRKMKTVAKLFRFLELCILLALLSWLSTRLPFAVRISGEYFWRFAGIILSPASIFLVGNAIVVTLLAKSGLFSLETSPYIENAVVNLFEKLRSENPDDQITSTLEDEQEIVYQDKEMISNEVNSKIAIPISKDDEEDAVVVAGMTDFAIPEVKSNFLRSQSENQRRDNTNDKTKTNQMKLQRSETDICRKKFAGSDENFPEGDDNMSNEEFQRTIEAFIARQVRFHREERLAVVLHSQA